MPRLPQLEYNVNVSGPPSVAQAYGEVGRTLQGFQDIQNQAMLDVAKEQAKAQTSTASAIVEQGLGHIENVLLSKPYLTPNEVTQVFGDQPIPPEVQFQLDKSVGKETQAVIPTYAVGGAIHRAATKTLATEAAKEIWSDEVRSEFEQKTQQEAIQRNVRLEHHLAQTMAQEAAAQAEVGYKIRAQNIVDPQEWTKMGAQILSDPRLSPPEQQRLYGEIRLLEAAQGMRRQSAKAVEESYNSATPDKGAAALEKALVGKDPLVAEDARIRFKRRAEEEKAFREMTESAPVARLESKIYSGQGFSRLDPDYVNLSDEGKRQVDKTALIERRTSKAATDEERRQQKELDAAALTRFRVLDFDEQTKGDFKNGDLGALLHDPQFANVSDKGKDAILFEQNKVKRLDGPSQEQFKAEVVELSEGLGYTPKGKTTEKSQKFLAHMMGEYTRWSMSPGNEGKRPPKELTNEWIRRALDYGERAGTWLQPNKYRWEAEMAGEQFTTEGFEKQQPAAGILREKGYVKPTRVVPGESIGQPAGTTWELQPNGKYKRVG